MKSLMRLIPKKKQWESWSLPSKLTALGALFGVISLGVAFFPNEKSVNIVQSIADGGMGITGNVLGDIHIGITPKQYEQGLKRREIEVTDKLKKAHVQDKTLLIIQLTDIKNRVHNLQRSYQEHINDIRKQIAQLESIRGRIPDELLDQAKIALANGNTKQADELFKQIDALAQDTLIVAAEASYQRCKIAIGDIRHKAAFPFCERAAQLATDNLIYLETAGDLAGVLRYDYLSKEFFKQAFSISLKSSGKKHSDVTRMRMKLGSAWSGIGEHQKAISYLETALSDLLESPEGNYNNIAVTLNNIGAVWYQQGEMLKAIGFYERAISTLMESSEDGVINIATFQNNIGAVWSSLGEEQKAITYFEKSLSGYLKLLDEDQPVVARTHINLGRAWNSLGKYKRAIGYLEQALTSFLRVYGEMHPDVAVTYESLGKAWDSLGGKQKAIGFYEQALAINLELFGEESISVVKNQNNLGNLWQSFGDPEKAISYYEQLLATLEKKLRKDHPNIQLVQANLDRVRREMTGSMSK